LKPLLGTLCIVLLLAFLGCGPSDGLVDVTGTVKVDGQPLEKGAISFEPVDGKSQTAGGTISSGTFKARVPPGKMKVKISAEKVVGKRKAYDTPDSPEVPIVDEALPKRYNAATELVSEVKPAAKLDFDLTTKP
jgi:hypothetical protein